MDWSVLAPIVAKYSLEAAEYIYTRWASGKLPTAEDFVVLRKMQQRTARDELIDRLTAAGIALDDPKAIALLAQVPA